jgi:cell shape-determining protein MreC
LVSLITNKNQSLTAEDNNTHAVGVIRGKGDGILVFENVVLSDTLQKGDMIVTKGDEKIDGTGYPPELVIGTITSIDKKVSDLFQTAEVESLIDFTEITTVFVITQ